MIRRHIEARDLCLGLMRADKENQVVALLRKAAYWDRPEAWRWYGDRESNFNTIGNQQSSPDAALVEKLVNAVDARLMNECLARGICPESPEAPQGMREAVGRFFEKHPHVRTAGLISEWPTQKRREVARGITLAATGYMPREGDPCFTICDCGEGQTPDMMPNTILSLDRTIKLRISFVQGKFNMGGTGALVFCGHRKLQLVLSRRNPALVDGLEDDPSHKWWGFTVVRREFPAGARRTSVYTYLAPVGAESKPHMGGVLRFQADSMPIFPEGQQPYKCHSEWGTLIKLYEYCAPGHKTHMFRKAGMLGRLDLLLPEVALPIRLHECRPYRGHEGSFETTMTGVAVRLEDDRAKNIEEGFPTSHPMTVLGEQIIAKVYVFRKGVADTYRKSEGIIFLVNGQTHGHFTVDFLKRRSVALGYLADSVLVIVDCSKMSGEAREDLFKNSRDRLSGGSLRVEVERTLEDLLKSHPGLRRLCEDRRRKEVESRLREEKPLADMLESLLRRAPSLSALFLEGTRIANPFKSKAAADDECPYQGKRYPSYFKTKGYPYAQALRRGCHINMRARIAFETDACNDYFIRAIDPGEFSLSVARGGRKIPVADYVLSLHNGVAILTVRLPRDCVVGAVLLYSAIVTDPSRVDAFENIIELTALKPAKPGGRGGSKRRRTPKEADEGSRELPAGISLPLIRRVYEEPGEGQKGWHEMSPPFDRYSALRVIQAPRPEEPPEGKRQSAYDFYVNVDNVFLRTEVKRASQDPEIAEARFIYGLVLLGLAMLREDAQVDKRRRVHEDPSVVEEGERTSIEDKIEDFSRAAASVILPMIEHLGGLDIAATELSYASDQST